MARLWLTKLALPALVVGCLVGSARAELVTTFIGTNPSQQVNVSATKNGTTRAFESPVGPFNFVVLSDTSKTGLGPTFRSFCADFFQDVALGNNYTFTPVAFADLPDVAGNATKMAKVQELYDRFYDIATDAEKGAGFQLALWEILYDPNKSDLSSGNFTASGPGNPSSIDVAQSMLDILDDPRYADPTKKYTLTGLHSPSAQDQIVPGTPVPGPAGVVLLVIGAAGLIARRKFAKKKEEAATSEATSEEAVA
jgi:hypothetical protein